MQYLKYIIKKEIISIKAVIFIMIIILFNIMKITEPIQKISEMIKLNHWVGVSTIIHSIYWFLFVNLLIYIIFIYSIAKQDSYTLFIRIKSKKKWVKLKITAIIIFTFIYQVVQYFVALLVSLFMLPYSNAWGKVFYIPKYVISSKLDHVAVLTNHYSPWQSFLISFLQMTFVMTIFGIIVFVIYINSNFSKKWPSHILTYFYILLCYIIYYNFDSTPLRIITIYTYSMLTFTYASMLPIWQLILIGTALVYWCYIMLKDFVDNHEIATIIKE